MNREIKFRTKCKNNGELLEKKQIMGSNIKTIPKEKMKGIKEMSSYMIDELMLLGFELLNNKQREENDEKSETIHQE